MIDLTFLIASVGYIVLLSSGLRQLYINIKQRYTGNQTLSLYLLVGIGTAMLIPATLASGRLDLLLGTIGNFTEMSLLVVTVLLWRKNKYPLTKEDKQRIKAEKIALNNSIKYGQKCKNCGHSIGWHHTWRPQGSETLTSYVACTQEGCTCTWLWCVEDGTCPKPDSRVDCPDPHNSINAFTGQPLHHGPKDNCGSCYDVDGRGGLCG